MNSAHPGGPAIDDNGEAAESRLSDVLWMFDALTSDKREYYMEEARKLLPPSLHNDKGSVLFTALRLMINDEDIKNARGVSL
jgi:hypothetical protein